MMMTHTNTPARQWCIAGEHLAPPAVSINGMHWCAEHQESGEPANCYRLPGSRYFNWNVLFNGEPHTLTGEMFAPMTALEFGRQVRKMAARRHLAVAVKTTSRDGERAMVRSTGPRPRFGVTG